MADAIYHTVHNFPGGVTALAARMGVKPSTLTHKANPNNDTHHLHPQELVALQHMSGDASVLFAMAAALGYTVQRATPDQTDGDMVEATMRLQVEFADLIRAAADPLARVAVRPAQPITGNEMRRAEYHANEVQAAMAHMLAALRAHMRRAPGE